MPSIFRKIPWQDLCKFLAGAFFVNSGILFYRPAFQCHCWARDLSRRLRSAVCAPSFMLFSS
jgi:hypothetical protein